MKERKKIGVIFLIFGLFLIFYYIYISKNELFWTGVIHNLAILIFGIFFSLLGIITLFTKE